MMDKEGRLYKLFNGSDTAVWAHDEIIKQDKCIAELENHIQSLKVINEYIDEGCPDMQVVRSEIGEVISRAEGTYLKAVKEKGE